MESAMDAYSILWADLMALKRRGPRFLITTLVSPVLYMVAFGWGLGRGMSLNEPATWNLLYRASSPSLP